MPFTDTGPSSDPVLSGSRFITPHLPLTASALVDNYGPGAPPHTNDVRGTVGGAVHTGDSVCATTASNHDGGLQKVLLQHAESATPRVPSSLVVGRRAHHTDRVLLGERPIARRPMGHDDQTRSRQTAGWAAMSVFFSKVLVPGARSELRTRGLSATAQLDEPYRALALTDLQKLGSTRRWTEPEPSALAESYGAPG